jgi:hypothetical protein
MQVSLLAHAPASRSSVSFQCLMLLLCVLHAINLNMCLGPCDAAPHAAAMCCVVPRRTLYIPPDDRSGWEQLQAQVLYLLAQALAARPEGPHNVQVGDKMLCWQQQQ